MSKKIPLANGKGFAVVDDEDFALCSQYKWRILEDENTSYALGYTPGPRNGPTIRMHRLVMRANRGEVVDHKNGDGLNNQKSNLRVCTHQKNMWNSRAKSNTKSGYKGVAWDAVKQKWKARIGHNLSSISLGYFDQPIDAAKAYDKAARELRGEFARTNFK
jgi:HNH endonuclease/AP2 domain